MNFVHCIIHTETSESRDLLPQLNTLLPEAVRIQSVPQRNTTRFN